MAELEQPRVIAPEDNEYDGGDSAVDLPIESTASLRSSILQYHQENGRRYHALSSGKYFLPNDEEEQDRLDILNHLFLLTYDGRHAICPKNENAKTVLDLGTGTGMWAMDFADAHPEAEVIGVDLSPIQPSSVPPNCRFEVDDLEQDWTWEKDKFDFIFARGLAGSFTSWPALMKRALDHLAPGGYIEIHDNLFPPLSDDGTLPSDSSLVKWCDFAIEGAAKLGRRIDEVPDYPKWLEEAGFTDVVTKVFKWPINRWPKDPGYKELGAWTLTAMDGGLEGLSMAVFTRGLGWGKDEILAFCSKVRNDFRNPKYHAYWNIVVTYGKKPESPNGNEV